MAYLLSIAQLFQSVFAFLSGIVVVNTFGEFVDLNEYYVIFSSYMILSGIIAAPFMQSLVRFLVDNENAYEEIKRVKKNSIFYGSLIFVFWSAGMLIWQQELGLSAPAFVGGSYTNVIIVFFLLLVINLLTAIIASGLVAKGKLLVTIASMYFVPLGTSAFCIFLDNELGILSILYGFFAGTLISFMILFGIGKKNSYICNSEPFLTVTDPFYIYFFKGCIGIFPLVVIGQLFIFITSQDKSIGIAYFTIAISFAGVISIFSSYGAFLLKISSKDKLDAIKTVVVVNKTLVLSSVITILVILSFEHFGKVIYDIPFDREHLSIFNALIISGIFISGYNIVRGDDWDVELTAGKVLQPIMLTIVSVLLFSLVKTSLGIGLSLCVVYSSVFMVLLLGRMLSIYGDVKIVFPTMFLCMVIFLSSGLFFKINWNIFL